jgi:hypothetical protein
MSFYGLIDQWQGMEWKLACEPNIKAKGYR